MKRIQQAIESKSVAPLRDITKDECCRLGGTMYILNEIKDFVPLSELREFIEINACSEEYKKDLVAFIDRNL